MNRRQLLVQLGAVGALAGTSGCATILHGPTVKGHRGKLRVGLFILELALTLGLVFVSINGLPITMVIGLTALIVDFSTGAIFHGPSNRDHELEDLDDLDDLDDFEDPELSPGLVRLDLCPTAGALILGQQQTRYLDQSVLVHMAGCGQCAEALVAHATPVEAGGEQGAMVVFRGVAAERVSQVLRRKAAGAEGA